VSNPLRGHIITAVDSQIGCAQAPTDSALQAIVRAIYGKYWPSDTPDHVVESDVRRYAASLRVLVDTLGTSGTVVDIGGGWGAFACACAAIGFHAITVDDCGDPGNADSSDARHAMPRDYGVEMVERDVARDGIDFEPASIDAFTSFDSIEHWHHSPKTAFHQMMAALRPGGLFLISAPNCNDFAKRITVPLGIAEWSSFDWWYHQPVFRSHVREPSVRDFRRIAEDLKLTNVRVFGRNDSLLLSSRTIVRALGRPLDYLLRTRSSLCTEIYLAGRKPIDDRVQRTHDHSDELAPMHTRPPRSTKARSVTGETTRESL
jgi:SAM-dependent methyltransferase